MADAPDTPAPRPAPRYPTRTVLVPQVTNIQAEAYRFVAVNLPREPWHKEEKT